MTTSRRPQKNVYGIYYLSQEGLKALKRQLNSLRQERRRLYQSMRAMKDARTHKHEDRLTLNEEINQLQLIEGEIASTEHILRKAKPITRPRKPRSVQLGSRVYLRGGGKKLSYTIVDPIEADPSVGKISEESPFGRMLIGKKLSDYIQWQFSTSSPKAVALKLVKIS
jgi:transcription elongation factor GreA